MHYNMQDSLIAEGWELYIQIDYKDMQGGIDMLEICK